MEQSDVRSEAPAARAAGPVYYGWVVVAVCFAVMTLISPVVAAFSIFYVAVIRDLGWSRGDTAIAMSIYLVVNGLAAPFAGGLIDRYGPRKVMPVGALVTAGALAWLSQVTALWQLYVAFGVIAAAGCAMLHIVPLTTVVSQWFVRNRGTAIGIVAAGQGVGQVLMPLLQYLIDQFGWRGAYLVLGAVILTVPTTLVLLFLDRRPEDRGLSVEDETGLVRARGKVASGDGAEKAPAGPKAEAARKREVVILDREWAGTAWTVGKAVKTFRFWALTSVMALFAAGFLMISVQLVAYLTEKGYSPVVAASVVSLQGLVNVVGRFAGGTLSDRIGREKTLTLSVSSFIVCLLLLNAAGSSVGPAVIYAFAIFYGMGSGMTLPALMASAADLFQGKHFGSILGVITLGGFSGGAVGAWLGGYFFDLTQAYLVNFLAAGAVMIVSASLMWKARPGRVRFVRIAPAS
ncbi:MAG: MFS transporter [Pyrinomonadaceae bacterium]